MMEQGILFEDVPIKDKSDEVCIGGRLFLKFNKNDPNKVCLFNRDTLIKMVDLTDRVAKRFLVVEAVEMGAVKTRLAKALQISRQTIHNYIETKKHFGMEGLINNYSVSTGKSRNDHRRENAKSLGTGNKARQLEQIRKEERERLPVQGDLFAEQEIARIEPKDQPFNEEHGWEKTRYAGVFVYFVTLITQNQWLRLIMKCFGNKYKIFMVFVLMAAHNIRSIEQLKNIHRREAGILLGMKNLPTRFKARHWLHEVSRKMVSSQLLTHYFRSQILTGIVGVWLWFTDGHHLPYTGKNKLHAGYNTQRRMPEPARTNLVTSDSSGRIVDFDIQEGKGDLRGYIVTLGKKWRKDLGHTPVMVFDREGYGASFFHSLLDEDIPFVTWEKYIDAKIIESLDPNLFEEEFEFNGKVYRVFEGEKDFTHTLENGSSREFSLRRIYIWNVTSNRRTCALAGAGLEMLNTKECAQAILNRWGASENTFKHIVENHPLHYQPGFEFAESEKQEIANPEYKEKKSLLKRVKTQLNRLYKKFSKTREVLKKDGSPRENSAHQRIKKEIELTESEIERLQKESKETPERIDISNLDDYHCFLRISNESKNLFDFVTSSIWNARKQMVEWLFPFYQNKNEYIDLFYAITHCHGWIKSSRHAVTVRLEPLQQPSRRAAQEQFCRKLTGLNALTPTGKSLVMEVGQAPLK
jgi:hypothetical protein